MNSQKSLFQPTEQEINRQTWACLGIFVLIWCMLVVLLGGLAIALVPRDIDRQSPAQDGVPAGQPDPETLLAQPGQETEEVTTQESSSELELEIPEPGTNLAYGKQVRASHELTEKPAEWAVDGKSETWWGAGAFPPQWVEVDLGANYVIAEIRLLPSQTPTGKTIHRLFVKGISTNDEYEILHTFQGVTADSRWIVLKFPEALRGVRYVRIETTSSSSWVSWREVEVIAGE
jgi:hypothetical protein